MKFAARACAPEKWPFLALRLILLPLSALGFTACLPPAKIIVTDHAPSGGPPTIRQIRATGGILHITLVQDSAPAWVSHVKARVINGDVYLSTFHVSSVVHKTEFTIDLSHEKFPRDWRDRLYWLEGDSISSPINPFIEHVRQIRRSKIKLAE